MESRKCNSSKKNKKKGNNRKTKRGAGFGRRVVHATETVRNFQMHFEIINVKIKQDTSDHTK
jgi:hypothetical protein